MVTTFRAINQNDEELVELAKNLSLTTDLWEHDLELGDGRIVRLMNVDKIGGKLGEEMWGVYADAGKGELVIEGIDEEIWTEQNEITYAPLRRKKLRIEAKVRRDKTRVRKFSHKVKKELR